MEDTYNKIYNNENLQKIAQYGKKIYNENTFNTISEYSEKLYDSTVLY